MKGCGWEMVMIATAAPMPVAIPCQTRGLMRICHVFGARFTKTRSAATSRPNLTGSRASICAAESSQPRPAVDEPPDDERPGGAVPEAGQEHHYEQVHRRPPRAAARAAERNEQVVPEPGGEAHVPASPEVRDVLGLERRVEVLREPEAEQPGE